MSASLVGSEMCIRDRPTLKALRSLSCGPFAQVQTSTVERRLFGIGEGGCCLLYTSDAADDM
eukprot:247617-Alexandrium_andersonii.AAC.1